MMKTHFLGKYQDPKAYQHFDCLEDPMTLHHVYNYVLLWSMVCGILSSYYFVSAKLSEIIERKTHHHC